jgi:hypothetical protein
LLDPKQASADSESALNPVEPRLAETLSQCFKALMALPSGREVSLICKVAAAVARSLEQDRQFDAGIELCQVSCSSSHLLYASFHIDVRFVVTDCDPAGRR